MKIQEHQPQDQMRGSPLILPFTALDASLLPLVGGKAANIGELTRAGLPVPEGFCVTTVAYERVSQQANLEPILSELDTVSRLSSDPPPASVGDITHLEKCANAARAALLATPVPVALIEAIGGAYQQLAHGEAVAVRSSATAEDLPFASFAGQQDSYLNVVGFDAVLAAVQGCWASLWTYRAVKYRENLGIDHRMVRLAIVVQRMVDAQVAGILFTAHPLSGRRSQMVLDASLGLGEAVVSGSVNPDHFVIDTPTCKVVERHLGDKRVRIRALSGGGTEQIALEGLETLSSLTDQQIAALVRLGQKVEEHYGTPQDIEWAIDRSGQFWLTQARPITTLYPLPAGLTGHEDVMRVYISINVSQGVSRPLTPMGTSALRLIGSSVATFLGVPPADPINGPAFLVEAGHRLFIDETHLFRSKLWRPTVLQVLPAAEARSGFIMHHLAADPRFTPISTPRGGEVLHMLTKLIRSRALFSLVRVLLSTGQALLNPKAMREHHLRAQKRLRALGERLATLDTSTEERLTMCEHLLLEQLPPMLSSLLPLLGLSLVLPPLTARLLGDLATGDEQQTVLRGLRYNPTTEMDLALWQFAQVLRSDRIAVSLLHEWQPEQLVRAYRAATLPPAFQQGLTDFLRSYGHRSITEIDLGLPSWSEDPTYLIGVLTNYLHQEAPEAAPDIQFQHGREAAEAMVAELLQRAKRRSWLRGKLVGFSLSRMRALMGLREAPKFDLVLLLSLARHLLLSVSEELVHTERLKSIEDIFFLNVFEVREAVQGNDMRAVVRGYQASYDREMSRQHIPRILLSDGTEPEALMLRANGEETGTTLTGTPASIGVVKGIAHVILEPDGAQLEPGEILVVPSTNPGWTPLFLTASGLVMEMGGPMSHGAVVAREYGIPAVVGVADATERIRTGQQITVDGSAGTIILTEESVL